MARHIALLRGINLGPSRRVSMAQLRAVLTSAGYEEVRTLLQSGNVVLSSDAKPDRLARELERVIADGIGVEAAVIVRTRDELADVVARDPFGAVVADPRRYQVTFLDRRAPAALAREIEAAAVEPEQVVVSGREVYAWHPDGIQRSALAKMLADRRLGVTATARNWNTVTRLLAMAGEE